MGSQIFRTILERKIDVFVSTFGNDGTSIFKNSANKLIHPGEYGVYREKCLKELIGFVIDKDLAISDGFLITATNNVSTQSDIIIYESNVLPLIDNGIAKFFPVEVVRGIGEVKSDLDHTMFKQTLMKLASNKKLFSERIGNPKKSVGRLGEYLSPFSFLVCNKLDFDITQINFETIYERVPREYWHNAILCIENGLITYSWQFSKYSSRVKEILAKESAIFDSLARIWEYPLHIFNISGEESEKHNCTVNCIKADQENPYKHIVHFLTILQTELPRIAAYQFDFVAYLGLGGANLFSDEKTTRNLLRQEKERKPL